MALGSLVSWRKKSGQEALADSDRASASGAGFLDLSACSKGTWDVLGSGVVRHTEVELTVMREATRSHTRGALGQEAEGVRGMWARASIVASAGRSGRGGVSKFRLASVNDFSRLQSGGHARVSGIWPWGGQGRWVVA